MPGLPRMLRDIRTGALMVDLILVDCLERFGRVDELPTIRKELFEKHGVLLVTGDSNFADPTSPAGKGVGMFEAMRSTEHGRILGHNVSRGKRDAAVLKHWVGGPAPFGYMLKSMMKTVNGREEVDYSFWYQTQKRFGSLFCYSIRQPKRAGARRGWREFLTNHPDIPEEYKPFHPPTIGYWIDFKIYCGNLVFEKNSTGIFDDRRVVEANDTKDMFYVPD